MTREDRLRNIKLAHQAITFRYVPTSPEAAIKLLNEKLEDLRQMVIKELAKVTGEDSRNLEPRIRMDGNAKAAYIDDVPFGMIRITEKHYARQVIMRFIQTSEISIASMDLKSS